MARNVIFDLDGTLVDSIPGIRWSVEVALDAAGVPATCPDLKPLIGPPIRDILATVTGSSDSARLDRMEAAFRASYDGGGWRRTTCQPGARETIRRLQAAGCPMWVVTNKPGVASRAILGELGLSESFREIVSRDSRIPRFSSKAEMLADLVRRCALAPADCIMVGDTLEDCQAAAVVGIECAVMPHGYGCGLDSALPQGCRVVAGWNELLQRCGAFRA